MLQDEYSEEADDSEEAVYSSDEEEEDGEDWDELDRKAKEGKNYLMGMYLQKIADKERAKVKRSRGEEYSDEEEESDKEEKPKKKKK